MGQSFSPSNIWVSARAKLGKLGEGEFYQLLQGRLHNVVSLSEQLLQYNGLSEILAIAVTVGFVKPE